MVERKLHYFAYCSLVVWCSPSFSDTVSRCGILCTLINVIERCKVEGVVDVFQAVEVLRTQKPGSVLTVVRTKHSFGGLTLVLKRIYRIFGYSFVNIFVRLQTIIRIFIV